jgi:hypothetical protein
MLVETLGMKIVLRVQSTSQHTQTIFLNPTKSLVLVLLVAHPVSNGSAFGGYDCRRHPMTEVRTAIMPFLAPQYSTARVLKPIDSVFSLAFDFFGVSVFGD